MHRSLDNKIKPIEIESADLQAISLQFHTGIKEVKLSIINVYDSQDYGAYKKRKENSSATEFIPTIDTLMEFLAFKNDLGEVYLTGDFNAYTGSENNEFYPDTNDENEGPDWRNNGSSFPIMFNRTSKDTVVNKRGNDFIDLLACKKLSLLNGCTIRDALGEFTYAGPNGKA